jgi:hypothetical protein
MRKTRTKKVIDMAEPLKDNDGCRIGIKDITEKGQRKIIFETETDDGFERIFDISKSLWDQLNAETKTSILETTMCLYG